MASALNVIEGALKLLLVKVAESPVTAAEAQDGLDSLNDMMAEWEENGIHTGFIPISDVDDTIHVPDYALGAVKAKLSLFIAPEYDKVPSPALVLRAKTSFTALRAALVRLGPSSFPDTLPIGSGNDRSFSGSDGDIAGDFSNDHFYPENDKRNF